MCLMCNMCGITCVSHMCNVLSVHCDMCHMSVLCVTNAILCVTCAILCHMYDLCVTCVTFAVPHVWCYMCYVGAHSGRVVTLSPPTCEAGVRSSTWPQVGKLVVACRWSAVYSTEP